MKKRIVFVVSLLCIIAFYGNAEIRLQYACGDRGAVSDNHIKPHFNIVNTTNASVALSDLKIRYYYTKEGTAQEQFWVDYAQVGNANVKGAFVSGYLEISFTYQAGSLAPSAASGPIQTRFNMSDWKNYDESNDYSWDGTALSFADCTRVTMYKKGVLVWGNPPAEKTPSPCVTPTQGATLSPTPTSVPTVAPPTPVPASTIGDVNGDGVVNVVDGLLVVQYYVGLNPSGFDSTNADVNGDGVVNIVDGLIILQQSSGVIPDPTLPTPVPVPGAGTFSLVADKTSVAQSDGFAVYAYVDAGNNFVAAYSLALTYPSSLVGLNDVTAGTDGFVTVVNANSPGTIVVSGFDAAGKGPGVIQLLVVNLVAREAGSADIALTPQQLVDPNAATIGTPQGASVSITITAAGPTAVPTETPEATPSPTPATVTAAPTEAPSPNPTPGSVPGAGNVWFEPASYSVNTGDKFVTYVHVNTGDQSLAAYGMDIAFVPGVLNVDTSFGDHGVETVDGSGSVVGGTTTPGLLRIGGYDTYGIPPNTNLPLLAIHWVALEAGTSALSMSIGTLADITYGIVGVPNPIDGSVTVYGAIATTEPESTPTPTPVSGPTNGNVWFSPSSYSANVGDGIVTQIRLDSGNRAVYAYGFTLTFPSQIIVPDTAIGNSSVEPGADGYVTAVNPNNPGSLVLNGFDISGKGPGTDLDFVRINWKAVGTGTARVDLAVDEMVDGDLAEIAMPEGVYAVITVN